MLKFYIFLTFIITSYNLIPAKGQPLREENLTNYIQKASKIKDLKLLNQYFYNNQLSNAEEFDIIKNIFLAEYYSLHHDKRNEKSTKHYNNAAKIGENISNKGLQIWLYSKIGFYYYTYNDYDQAFNNFIKSDKLLQNSNHSEIVDAGGTLKINGYFWQTIEDYKKSNEFLLRSLEYTSKKEENYGAILNAIAHNYRALGDNTQTFHYLEKTKQLALRNNDKIRYAKAIGDIAIIKGEQGHFDIAEKLLLEDISISKAQNSTRNTMFAELELAKIYTKNKQTNKAKNLLTNALKFTNSKNYLNSYQLEIQKTLLQIAIEEKNTITELEARRKIESLEKAVAMLDSPDIVKTINWKSQKERVIWQLEAEKSKAEKSKIIRWSLIIGLILLCLLIISIIRLYQKKVKHLTTYYQKEILRFKLEQIENDKKFEEANKSLENFKIYLQEKNKQIDKIDVEITKLKDKNIANKMLLEMEALKISHLMTYENWAKFKEVFKREEPIFYKFITNNYPDLTDSNLRIILLNHLALNNIEIAQLIGVSIDAVKKAKQRLRKKLDDSHVGIL